MASATSPIQQPRNEALDIVDMFAKAQPLVFGSGKTSSNETRTMDPAVSAQTDAMIAQLLTRANSSAQADKVVEDILYRAQLAFAPILGEEKQAGLYNSTTRNLLAKEAIARATAASAAAVLQDQQQAATTAASLQNQKTAATGSKSGSQQTAPAVSGKQLVAGAGTAYALGKGFKYAEQGAEKAYDFLRAPGAGIDSGSIEDASGNLYDPGNLESYFVNSGPLNPGNTAGDFGPASVGADGIPAGGAPMIADDTAALQGILDSATVPSAAEGVQVASAAGETASDVSAGTIGEALASGGGNQVITGGFAMPPAIPVDPFTGMPNAMPAAVPEPEGATLLDPTEATDPFAFEPGFEGASEVGAGAEVGAGTEVAAGGGEAVAAGGEVAASSAAAGETAAAGIGAGAALGTLGIMGAAVFGIGDYLSEEFDHSGPAMIQQIASASGLDAANAWLQGQPGVTAPDENGWGSYYDGKTFVWKNHNTGQISYNDPYGRADVTGFDLSEGASD